MLDTANMTAADEQQARDWLPQMRVFLRDLLVAERQEFERGDYETDDPDNSLVITADDLRAAQRALRSPSFAGASGTAGSRHGFTPCAPRSPCGLLTPAGRTLLVCIGPDSALMLDLAALRAVRSATGLKFMRLLDATRPKFADTLRRERSLGRPVELLHLALHASPEGVEFADGVADGNWLSERLFGVRIMLLAELPGRQHRRLAGGGAACHHAERGDRARRCGRADAAFLAQHRVEHGAGGGAGRGADALPAGGGGVCGKVLVSRPTAHSPPSVRVARSYIPTRRRRAAQCPVASGWL